MTFRALLLSFLALATLSPDLAEAQGQRNNPFQPDQLAPSQPRDAVREGRQMPLSAIVARLRRQFGGELLDANQVGDVYRIRWKTAEGRLLDLSVDAQTGAIVG